MRASTEARLAALELRVAALEHDAIARASLSRADVAALSSLLPAVGGAFGSEPFLTRELFTSDAAAVRLVMRGWNARRVGRLFQRGAGHVVDDGYLVERAGVELHATLWCVARTGSAPPEVPPLASPGLVK